MRNPITRYPLTAAVILANLALFAVFTPLALYEIKQVVHNHAEEFIREAQLSQTDSSGLPGRIVETHRNLAHSIGGMISEYVILVALIFILVQIALVRWLILRHVMRVRNQAAAIAEDPEKIGQTVEEHMDDELGRLARAFNRLSIALKKERESMSAQIADATKSLEAKQKELVITNQQLSGMNEKLRAGEKELRRAYEKSKERSEQLRILTEGGRAVMSLPDFRSVARALFDLACEATGAASGYVAMLSEDGSENEVLFLESGGLDCTVDPSLPMPIRGLRSEAYRDCAPKYDNDFMNSPWADFMPDGHVDLRNVMFAPIIVDGKAIGLLGMANKDGDFTDNDAKIAEALASLAAVAFTRIRAMENLCAADEFNTTVLETAQAIILELDTEARIVRINPYMEELTGYTLGEIKGKDWFALFLPWEDQDRVRELFKKSVAEQYTRGNINPIVTRSGDFRDILWYDKTLKNHDGSVRGVLAVGLDVTDLKAAQKRNADLARISEESPNPMMRIQADGELIYRNRASDMLKEFAPRAGEVVPASLAKTVSQAVEGNLRRTYVERVAGHSFLMTIAPVTEEGYANVYAQDLTDILSLQKELGASAERWQTTFDAITDVIVVISTESEVLSINRAGCEHLGLTRANIVGGKCYELFHGENSRISVCPCVVGLLPDEHREATYEQDGRHWRLVAWPITDDKGVLHGFVHVMQDTTALIGAEKEREALAEQLRQAQKLEAIGQLAGGVAHDFNNMIGGIVGYADLLTTMPSDEERVRHYSKRISQAAFKASDLTQQLLTFARKVRLKVARISTEDCINIVIGMLSRTIDKRIDITTDFASGESIIQADAGQVENCLLNLGINARDALPEGGTICFSTADAVLPQDAPALSSVSVTPGAYVRLSVEDNGVGMDDAIKKRIFEPFFTTKAQGKGTGLGLATVYGSVKQHNGYVCIESEPGKGSRFDIFLPVADRNKDYSAIDNAQNLEPGTGRVVVVDDEDAIREIATEMLVGLGYSVTSFADGISATEYVRANPDNVDLVLLDMIMPKQHGADCFREIKKIRADIPVVVMSGYSHAQHHKQVLAEGAISVVGKPFNVKELSKVVKQAFETRGPRD